MRLIYSTIGIVSILRHSEACFDKKICKLAEFTKK